MYFSGANKCPATVRQWNIAFCGVTNGNTASAIGNRARYRGGACWGLGERYRAGTCRGLLSVDWVSGLAECYCAPTAFCVQGQTPFDAPARGDLEESVGTTKSLDFGKFPIVNRKNTIFIEKWSFRTVFWSVLIRGCFILWYKRDYFEQFSGQFWVVVVPFCGTKVIILNSFWTKSLFLLHFVEKITIKSKGLTVKFGITDLSFLVNSYWKLCKSIIFITFRGRNHN